MTSESMEYVKYMMLQQFLEVRNHNHV